MKNIFKIALGICLVGGMFSFTNNSSLEKEAIATDGIKTVHFETNDSDEFKHFDFTRYNDILSRENWNDINSIAKISLFKLKITVKKKAEGTDIDISGGM